MSAGLIHEAYLSYQETFQAITRRARFRFDEADWAGVHADALERRRP